MPLLIKQHPIFDIPRSIHVLGWDGWCWRVVVLEQWDYETSPVWYSACSEHWELKDGITHWTILPNKPRLEK